jgi:hypothetical protein
MKPFLASVLFSLLSLLPAAAAENLDPLSVVSNGKEIAYSFRAAPGSSIYVASKGQRLGPYEALVGLAWSPDGSRLVYQAKSGGSWRLYDGATASGPCDDFGELLWSSDGATLAWAAPSGGAWFVHRGAASYGPYEDVVDLGFTGQSLSWEAKRGGKWYVAFDGATAGPFDSIEWVIPSPDGTKRAVMAIRGSGHFLCRASSVLGPWDTLYADWSRDGKNLLYSYEEKGKAWFCADDVKNGPYDEIRWGGAPPCTSSADLWAARLGQKWYFWAGGKRQGPFDEVLWLGRGPDGQGLHYAVRRKDQAYVVTGKAEYGPFFADYVYAIWNNARSELMPVEETDAGKYLHDGDARIGPYEYFGDEVSPSGRGHLVWISGDDGNRFIAPDGRVSEPFERSNWPLVWSPDETKVAFTTMPEDYSASLFDGTSFTGPFPNPQGLVWSPDGSKLAFWSQGDDGDIVYLGKEEVMRFDRGYLELAFSPDGKQLLCVHHEGWEMNSPSRLRIGAAEYGPYLDATDFRWSADGTGLAWKARDAAGCHLCIRDKASGPYEDIRGIAWAGGAVAFEGYRDGAWRSRLFSDGQDRPGCRSGDRAWHLDGTGEVRE